MQISNQWKQFESSGKVDDYLKYRRENSVGTGQVGKIAGVPKEAGREADKQKKDAGFRFCDRDDTQANRCR